MCGAFEKQQLKVCGEQKSSWSPLTSSAKYLESRKATWRRYRIQGCRALVRLRVTPITSFLLAYVARNQYEYLTHTRVHKNIQSGTCEVHSTDTYYVNF